MLCKKSLMIGAMLLIFLTAASSMAVMKKPPKIKVSETVYVGGTEIQSGEYKVTWESNSPKAMLTFSSDGKAAVKAEGKVVDMDKAVEFDTLIIGKDSAGRKAIREIRFAGGKTSIVFE
jgi:hypothetical protein